jgi:rhamnogalacturonyl hydrolase YesR
MHRLSGAVGLMAALSTAACSQGAAPAAPAAPDWRQTGRSEAGFALPSLAPGVDYTLPIEADMKQALDRIRGWFEKSTPYRVIDTATGQPVTDFAKPTKTAGIDLRTGEFNDWTYSMGVVYAGMLALADVTKDPAYEQYVLRNFDFVFDHIDYFRRQAAEFGPQAYGYRRLITMRELDDCGAIGAALIKAFRKKADARYRQGIDLVADFISNKMSRLPDRTLARHRPQWPTVWADDAYMSIPFLAQMGDLTGDKKYFDDGAHQVIKFAEYLMDPSTGLFDHTFFANAGMDGDMDVHWGRAGGWVVMAIAELLSVMPESHPQRARVLEIFRRSIKGHAPLQSATGLWRQVLDRPDSYLETSATAMFTFAIARGVNRGWLPLIYAPMAQAGWKAVEQRIRPDGMVDGTSVATTAAYDMVYYYNRPARPDAMQGFGAVLLAGAEVITMLRQFDVDKTLNTFHYRPKGAAKTPGGRP